MNQIWVSGDWHLFNRDPFDKRHPTRTPDEFQTMYDNYVSTIKEGDLFLFLGDLCDAETATDEELDLIKSLLHAIPGYKVMMRGNHDTMDDYFYLMLGFDEVCQIGKCHHLVFSHKPCLVGIDEINIHAHLHSEKDHMLNFQHMNVWKWTELNGTPDKPVLLQDLFDLYDKISNTAEPSWGDPDVYQSKDKLSPWKKLSDYSEKDVLDFSDKFTLAPMDEAVGDRTMEEIVQLNDRLNGFKYGFRSDDGISDEYLSDYRVLSPVKFERARGGVCWDFAVYQADYFRKNFPSVPFTMWYVIFDVGPYWPTHTFMTFRYEGKTYYFESSFKRCAGVWEIESEEDAVNFVMHEMASIDTGVDDLLSHDYYVYRYNALDIRIPGMSAPEFMKHIEKKGHPVKHIYRDDYTVSLYNPVNESADTSDVILDEVLFQDIEQTKRWLADDDTYQNELDATEYSDSRKPTKMRGKNGVIAESSKRKVYKDPTELHKPDRAESNKIAKKYDIPNVGRTTPEEYEEARKSPEERSAERRERQLTQLQRARSVKKRKSIVRKVKSKIPFVKNESVEAIALRSDRMDTTGSIYTKIMQSEGGKITEYAMMCADLIHSITSINPELLDAQRVLTVQSAEELITEFKRQQSEWIEQYNKNITFDHQLALLYQVMNARRGFKIKEAYPYLIPYNLSPEKFRQYVQYRIDEWREMINILEEALRINLQFLVLDSAEAARISSITDKKHFIKEMKKVVDQNADRITEKHPDGSRTIDFSIINRGKVFICGQVYDEQKFMRKPSQYLARLSYYDYIIVTHGGSSIKGTWTMDPITFDNVSYDKVTDLLDVLGQDGSQILVMTCNPDGIKLPPKKYGNVDYADVNVIMESGGAISSQIDLSNWSKEIKKSIKRVNKLKAIINTCVTDAYLLTPPDQIQFITTENFELSHDTNFVFATVAVKNDKKAVQKYHYAFNTILGVYESINHAANIICAVAQQYGDSSNRGYRVKAIREDIDDANLYESFWAEGNQIRDVYLMPEDIVLPDPMMCCEAAYAFDLGVRNGKPFACNYLIETIQNGNVVDRTPVSHQELYDVINASSDSVVSEFDISGYDSTEHSPLYGDRKHFFYNYDMPKEENTSAEKITINESASLTSYRSIAKRIHSYAESKKNDVVGNQNCMLCTWAFELSCRGQQTNPRPVYSPRDIIFSIAGESIVKNPVRIHFTTKTELSRIVKEAGNNARFYIHVNWNNCTGGHEFIILNNSGKVVVVDPQAGYVGDIDSRGSATYFDINYANSYLCRLDDKVIDANTLKYNDITYLTEWDEDIDIPYMKEHNMLDESVDSLDEGVLSDAIKDLPAIINNLSADAMYTGNWAKVERGFEKLIRNANSMEHVNYLRRDVRNGINTMEKLLENMEKVQRGELSNRDIERRIDGGNTPTKVREHIKWMKNTAIPMLNERAKELRRSTNESSIQVVNEMAYEDYCDHFYTRLKSLAAEYNKREDIFKHTAKILKCDQKDLPKFECHVETSSEKQLCFSMVDPNTSFEIKCEYEKYLKEMIEELEKDAKEYPGAKSIWTADAEGTIYVNLELGQLNEAAIKRVSDDGKPVPKTCPKCGAKIGLYLKGEPVWICSNQKCGAYYGTAPMNESAMCSTPLYYLSYENLHDDLYPVGKCLFTTIDQAVSEVVWESKNKHPQNKTHIPCDMFVHVTEPGYYELRSSDQVCGAKWSIDNITLNCIGRVHINADGSYEMMKNLQESYQFELVNKTLRFMDPINESVNKTEKLYPVYIMLVHSGTAVSNVIKKVSHSEYSHASISFDSSMSKMYSFARKDPKNPFIGGFRYESIGKGFYEKKEVPYGVYVVPCTEDQIKRMKKRLAYFEKNQEKFTFDFVGLVTNYAGIVNNPAYSWFCSRFVADILNAGSPEGKVYVPEPSLQDPDDFKRAVFARYVTSGNNLMEYNQKEVDRATKRILRAEEMYRKQLNESVHYNRFDPTDPYAVTVMRYQLSNMNEAVMDEFLRYIKSFHVELDPNGNVILTRRVYNQLDHHFIQTKQALKTMKKAGDLEGMKENLAKLYYMIQLITDQYMDKKTVSISKTVKKDMIDLRSVMLNVFQQNLQYVEEMDPKFNFQSYYDGSVYGKKTKIPISGVTSIGKTLGTLL